MALGHGQYIGAHIVDLADVEFAGAVLLKLNAELIEEANHGVAALGVGHDRLLVDDAVVGDGDLLHVLLRRGVAGNDRVVQPVHSHGDSAAALDVRLLHENNPQGGVSLLGLYRGHRASGASAQDQQIGLDHFGLGVARHSHGPPRNCALAAALDAIGGAARPSAETIFFRYAHG